MLYISWAISEISYNIVHKAESNLWSIKAEDMGSRNFRRKLYLATSFFWTVISYLSKIQFVFIVHREEFIG